jgi:hypothetical protein
VEIFLPHFDSSQPQLFVFLAASVCTTIKFFLMCDKHSLQPFVMTALALNIYVSMTAILTQNNSLSLPSFDDGHTIAGQTSSDDEDELDMLAFTTKPKPKITDRLNTTLMTHNQHNNHNNACMRQPQHHNSHYDHGKSMMTVQLQNDYNCKGSNREPNTKWQGGKQKPSHNNKQIKMKMLTTTQQSTTLIKTQQLTNLS